MLFWSTNAEWIPQTRIRYCVIGGTCPLGHILLEHFVLGAPRIRGTIGASRAGVPRTGASVAGVTS